jgi:uncharacterized protein (TIGR03067 family)
MLSYQVFLVLVGLGAQVGPPKVSPEQVEMKTLEGTWIIQSATLDGKQIGKEKGGAGSFIFAGDKLTMKTLQGKEEVVRYNVGPSKKPKTIDFSPEDKKPKSGLGKGIYQIEGDILKLCVGPPDTRPTEFNDKGQVLFTMKKKKSSR